MGLVRVLYAWRFNQDLLCNGQIQWSVELLFPSQIISYCNWLICSIFICYGKDILCTGAAGPDCAANYSAGQHSTVDHCMVCSYRHPITWDCKCTHWRCVAPIVWHLILWKHKKNIYTNTFSIFICLFAVSILSAGPTEVWCQVSGMYSSVSPLLDCCRPTVASLQLKLYRLVN